MNDKEAEKKQREVAECEPVAATINRESGTDYVAKPTNVEPADVLLESTSRKFPDRLVQVVSIPHDYEVRADNKNVARLKVQLCASLTQRRVTNCFVGLSVLENTARRGVPPAQVEHLADAIRDAAPRIPPTGTYDIGYMQLLGIDPELTAYLSNAVLFREENDPSVTVDTPGVAAELPDDGSWVEQGIELKLKKYGGAKAVANLTLVIGVEALVDKQQVDAFKAAHPAEELPFAEIWINSMEGPICLKARS